MAVPSRTPLLALSLVIVARAVNRWKTSSTMRIRFLKFAIRCKYFCYQLSLQAKQMYLTILPGKLEKELPWFACGSLTTIWPFICSYSIATGVSMSHEPQFDAHFSLLQMVWQVSRAIYTCSRLSNLYILEVLWASLLSGFFSLFSSSLRNKLTIGS